MKTEKEIYVLTDAFLITCIVQKGKADDIVQAAREAGAQGATIFYAKGSGVRERLGVLGVAVDVEKEIIQVVVASDQVDHVFEKMYVHGKLDTPAMGFIFVTKLDKAATYIPKTILDKLNAKEIESEA